FPLKKEKRSWSMLNSFCPGGDNGTSVPTRGCSVEAQRACLSRRRSRVRIPPAPPHLQSQEEERGNGVIKIRITGLPNEVTTAVKQMQKAFRVLVVSPPYPNRNSEYV